jgi:hypothetical protein
MDGTEFDQLVRRLATTRLTRLTTLRGLAAGAVASLAGMSLLGEEGAAKKNNPKKRKVCLCSPASCTTKRVKNRAKVIRRNAPCAYKGKCTSFNPCAAQAVTTAAPAPPGFNCTTAGCVGPNAGLICNTETGQCVNCANFAQCAGLQACFNGRCQGFVGCNDDGACEGLVSSDRADLVCNEDGNINSEAPDDVCIFNPDRYEGLCNAQNDCAVDNRLVCVLGSCVVDCRENGQDDCEAYYGALTPFACEEGLCLAAPAMISDRAVKADFATVDGQAVLAQIAALPIQSWRYQHEEATVRHIGPMAQDFAAAFHVGDDERRIHVVDGQGVALAAIQGLLEELRVLRAENAALAARVATLERHGEA